MIYLIIGINLLSFILMGIDKLKAIKNNYRISENTLLLISIIGGGIGTLIGMILFHHKTKKLKFQILVPISILINIYLYSLII